MEYLSACLVCCCVCQWPENIGPKQLFLQYSGYSVMYRVTSSYLCYLLSLRYAVLRDPAGWLSVNPVRGTVNTSSPLDRESPYVHDNKYTAVFIATDNGTFLILHWMKIREDNLVHTYIHNFFKGDLLRLFLFFLFLQWIINVLVHVKDIES